jgi:RsiW-degrading membrane proteinase PrsW (M82 family)
MNLAVLALFCLAFAFILRGEHEERSLIFLAIAAITAHCFPACFSLRQLHAGKTLTPNVSSLLFGLNLATLPASVAALLLPGVTEVLLVSVIVTLHQITC